MVVVRKKALPYKVDCAEWVYTSLRGIRYRPILLTHDTVCHAAGHCRQVTSRLWNQLSHVGTGVAQNCSHMLRNLTKWLFKDHALIFKYSQKIGNS